MNLFRWMSLLLLFWPRGATAQCVAGPDAEAQRALQTAFEAQSAVSDHLVVAELDRESRELSDAVRGDERASGTLTAQATLNLETSSVRGFSVCDLSEWERATLQNQALGAAASIGSRGVARLELRVFGISDSVIQQDLSGYYPEREAGSFADVPGATGLGHGLWSARVELLDAVALTVGRVSSHGISHSVGWSEEVDEDGNTSISKSQTAHWGAGANGRAFVAIGVPALGGGELIIGENVELARISSGWITPRPRQPLVTFRADVGWDGLVSAPFLGTDVTPLGGPFDARGLPTFRLRTTAEATSSPLREASVSARWSYRYEQAGLAVPGELAAAELSTGVFGGSRLKETRGDAFVPGVVARVDAAIPIYAVLRISAWGGVNRAETIAAVPDAVGRPEWGLGVYATYSR